MIFRPCNNYRGYDPRRTILGWTEEKIWLAKVLINFICHRDLHANSNSLFFASVFKGSSSSTFLLVIHLYTYSIHIVYTYIHMLTAVQLVKKMKPYCCLTLFLGLWSSSSQDQIHKMSIILSMINLIFAIFMFAKTF